MEMDTGAQTLQKACLLSLMQKQMVVLPINYTSNSPYDGQKNFLGSQRAPAEKMSEGVSLGTGGTCHRPGRIQAEGTEFDGVFWARGSRAFKLMDNVHKRR